MLFSYDISTDRFLLKSAGAKSSTPHNLDKYEYFRYVPEDEAAKERIRNFLVNDPQEICFEITNKCNLSCPICIANAGEKNTIFLQLSFIDKTLKTLSKHFQRVTITGGETTLHPNITDILSLSTERYGTVLSTNGYYPEQIDYISKNYKNLIIAISLHGPREIHDSFVGKAGAFDNALKSIKLSVKNGAFTHVYTTASKQNINYFKQLSDLISGLGVIEHRINLVKPKGRQGTGSVSWEEVYDIINSRDYPHRIAIKREEQPFLFVSCHGEMEIKNV
ncbi:MAG: radical SAM protein [Bacteroidales bacterium]|jgi:MoaA/NifB/PqqE/SkfB family radical SAM enzyme